VIDGPKAVPDVGVQHPVAAVVGLDPDGLKGLVGRALGSKPIAGRQEVGLKHRLQDQLRCRHHHPIAHGGNAKRPGLARLPRLGNVHPPQRRRPVAPGPQLCGELLQEARHPGRLDLINGHTIHAGRPSVGSHSSQALPMMSPRATLSNRAWNRRCGCCLALRYSTRCKARTLSRPSALAVDLALTGHSPNPSSSTLPR